MPFLMGMYSCSLWVESADSAAQEQRLMTRVFLKKSWGLPGCVLGWASHVCQNLFLLQSQGMGTSGPYQLPASSNLR